MAVIGFDARTIRTVTTGMGRVARCLLDAIVSLDTDNQYVVFQRSELNEPVSHHRAVRTVRVSYDIASLRNQFFFSRVLDKYKLDVYHSLNAFLPYWIDLSLKAVITIHDFNWIQRPTLSAPQPWIGHVNGLYGKFAHYYSVTAADHIVCISNQTKRDLHTLYPSVRSPVTTIHHGHREVDTDTHSIRPDIRAFRDRKYILSVGNGRPYKNPEGTIKAFSRLRRTRTTQDIVLVMVGRGDTNATLNRLVESKNLGDAVIFLGMVSDSELQFLMTHALFLSFPSRWEGFGLPVLEAFAAGCPVVASHVGSLPEVCGDAAFFIYDPESIEEIALAFELVVHDATLREQLRTRGDRKSVV